MENLTEIVAKILQARSISFSKIKRASSGFTNDVFLVDKKYVVKLTNDKNKKWRLQKEIDLYKSFKFDFVPSLIADGEMDGYKFLIISQVRGKSLYSIWHKLDNETRRSIVGQIANILQQFHQLEAKLPKVDVIKNWQKYWKIQNRVVLKQSKHLQIDTHQLALTLKENLKCFKDGDYCLIYNDAHFDNFIYDNGKLSLIDFDRVLYCPMDYELMIIKSMCDEPWKFANEEDEKNTNIEDYKNILPWLKEFYPKMFDCPFLKERLRAYQFHYYFCQAYAKKDRQWAQDLIEKYVNKKV